MTATSDTTPSGGAPIDTSKVTDCRELDFRNVDDAIADAERLVQAEHDGSLRALGNWTLGQALGHVAAWTNYPYDGYPSTPPWFVRVIGRFLKARLFRGRLPRGYRLPGVAGGTFAIDPMSTDEGLDRFRAALRRLAAAPPTMPNPVFGRLTHDEWLMLNLKHAALHLGYFIPE